MSRGRGPPRRRRPSRVRWSLPERGACQDAPLGLGCRRDNALNRHGGTVRLPTHAATKFDYEVELVMVMGKEARRVSEADALSYVAGYSTGNDFTARDLQLETGGQWMAGKTPDEFAPLGPYLLTADQIDPDNLKIELRLNGETRQSSNTSDFIRGAVWSKLILNCSVTTLGAIAGRTMRQYIATPEGRELFDRTYDEALAVALGSGARPERMLVDPVPPGWNGHGVPGEAHDAWLGRVLEGYGDVKPSMLQDFERGRTTEGFALGASIELPRRLRVNVVSPPWISETLAAMKKDPRGGIPAAACAKAYLAAVEGTETGTTIDARKYA